MDLFNVNKIFSCIVDAFTNIQLNMHLTPRPYRVAPCENEPTTRCTAASCPATTPTSVVNGEYSVVRYGHLNIVTHGSALVAASETNEMAQNYTLWLILIGFQVSSAGIIRWRWCLVDWLSECVLMCAEWYVGVVRASGVWVSGRAARMLRLFKL
ncbi:hypothetical protein SFRURICE_006699 [Spodoptera frugiperda]|nr:hypothetical protein SFRURICE_006699 [Spodoptera frugiperda]